MGLDVSVIVPVHNRCDTLGPCLDSVPFGVELVVVDDKSSDGAPDFVERHYPRARLLRNEKNMGFGATVNRGLSAAGGDVMLVLNSDARLMPGALERLVEQFAADRAVGVAGPHLVFEDGSHQTSAASFPTVGSVIAGAFALNEVYRRVRPDRRFRWELGLSRADHERTQDVDWVMGACLTISRPCFQATGGFDPAYRMYFEECDLCWRARQAGFKVRYVADATACHLGGASGGDAVRQARMIVDGEATFMRRVYGPTVLRRWRWARITSSVLKLMAFGLGSPFDHRMRTRCRWHYGALSRLATTSFDTDRHHAPS